MLKQRTQIGNSVLAESGKMGSSGKTESRVLPLVLAYYQEGKCTTQTKERVVPKEKIRSFVANESAPKSKNTFTPKRATTGGSFSVCVSQCHGSSVATGQVDSAGLLWIRLNGYMSSGLVNRASQHHNCNLGDKIWTKTCNLQIEK